ncbi:hypothetical protein D3C81_1869610 [compost metagenome]
MKAPEVCPQASGIKLEKPNLVARLELLDVSAVIHEPPEIENPALGGARLSDGSGGVDLPEDEGQRIERAALWSRLVPGTAVPALHATRWCPEEGFVTLVTIKERLHQRQLIARLQRAGVREVPDLALGVDADSSSLDVAITEFVLPG